MKKLISVILVLCFVLLLSGCSVFDIVRSDFDIANSKIKPGTIIESESPEVKATITTKSGETKEMTYSEILELAQTNTILFNNEYNGATITVTSTIKRIVLASDPYDSGHLAEVDLDVGGDRKDRSFSVIITQEEAATLNVGDTMTANGKINGEMYGFYIEAY